MAGSHVAPNWAGTAWGQEEAIPIPGLCRQPLQEQSFWSRAGKEATLRSPRKPGVGWEAVRPQLPAAHTHSWWRTGNSRPNGSMMDVEKQPNVPH